MADGQVGSQDFGPGRLILSTNGSKALFFEQLKEVLKDFGAKGITGLNKKIVT